VRRYALVLVAAMVLAACKSAPEKPDTTAPTQAGAAAGAKDATLSPEQRYSAALDLMKGGDNAEAEKAFVALGKEFPDYAGPWTNLGILYAKSKRRDAAINAFKRATELKPDNVVAWNWLGIEYREAGNYPAAQAAYEQAIKANANDALSHFNYGILLDQYLNRPQEAIEQYQRYQALIGKEDLPTIAWVAELQAKIKPATPAAAPAAATASGVKP